MYSALLALTSSNIFAGPPLFYSINLFQCATPCQSAKSSLAYPISMLHQYLSNDIEDCYLMQNRKLRNVIKPFKSSRTHKLIHQSLDAFVN